MIIYNPEDKEIIEKRITEAEKILNSLPYKYCFVTGSFLFKKKYKDIDIFVLTRSKKKIKNTGKRIIITRIDFNDIYSLFYHSVSKSCIAKNILPKKPVKITVADYWGIINEAIPTILNQKNKYHKDIRYLILYTEYLINKRVLDTYELTNRIAKFKNYKEILAYAKKEIPKAIIQTVNKNYIKRYFYTQAGFYKDMLDYKSQRYLYELAHGIISEA